MGQPTDLTAKGVATALAQSHAGPDPCGSCDLVHEADHRIANHLALLTGYVRLKSHDLTDKTGELTKADVQLLLENVASQIGAVAKLHRALATVGPNGAVDLDEHLRALCEPFQSGFAGPVQIITELSPRCNVRPHEILPLTQIVSEILTNAVKYAYPSSKGGPIHIRCSQNVDDIVEIEVTDQGQGLPEAFDPKADGGLGFRLIRALAHQLDADLAFLTSPSGTVFRLRYTPQATPKSVVLGAASVTINLPEPGRAWTGSLL